MKKIKVTFFQRKRYPNGNYSLEFIFDDVRSRLKDTIYPKTAISYFHSKGLFKRVYNILEAPFKQGDVNHITGDIHYVSYLLNSRKTILTILDCGFMEGKGRIVSFFLKLFWLTIPIKRSRYITAISTFTKSEILKYVDCDPSKIRVIPVAINEKFTFMARGFNHIRPELLQIGSAPNKNLSRIIGAVKGLNIHLSLVGVLSNENKILLDKYKISYTNYVNLSDQEIINRYIECDILVFPSTLEGFGMPILEAQAVGRPVITSNITSMPEVAGNSAHLVDPYDVESIKEGIQKVINDKNYREELISLGFLNVKKYDPNLIARMYYNLYKEIE